MRIWHSADCQENIESSAEQELFDLAQSVECGGLDIMSDYEF